LDLHTTSINQARQQSTVAIHQAIEKIINDFRSNKSTCALSYDDSAVLLARNPKFKRYLNWIKDTNPDFQYKIDTSTFGAACVRYLNCSNQNDKKSNNISTSEYQICVNDISRKFVSYMDNFLSNDAIGNFNYGDEIFENGTLEDSSFDIMYDIEQINKILLANPKVIPSYYLRGPPNYLSIQNSKFKIQN
jgi:hypothetical protein